MIDPSTEEISKEGSYSNNNLVFDDNNPPTIFKNKGCDQRGESEYFKSRRLSSDQRISPQMLVEDISQSQSELLLQFERPSASAYGLGARNDSFI